MFIAKGRKRTKPWIYLLPALVVGVDRWMVKFVISWIVYEIAFGFIRLPR